jgi:pimeloyl-ACP methyl ester carboxylesterase
MAAPYQPRVQATSLVRPVRGQAYHLLCWGDLQGLEDQRPPLVLVHGWMDVAASFQFLVDALHEACTVAGSPPPPCIVAPDWRGFGRTHGPATDAYWFPDYLGDLDALLAQLWPDQAIDLVGHSMGGNIALSYAGVRPGRIRRLVNLEGFGMPRTQADEAPARLATWLDELARPAALRDYASAAEVAERLRRNNPRLRADRAAWLAPHWAEPTPQGRWALQADPAHKHVNPTLYRVDEALACWRRIQAPVLWVEGADSGVTYRWADRYPASEVAERRSVIAQVELARLADCGHMLHHDQPEALAALLRRFLGL